MESNAGNSVGTTDLPIHTDDSGRARLNELGYKQELKRDLSVFSNFGFTFSLISVLGGVTILYNTGLTYGGPVTMVYGWPIVGFFTMLVGLSMAEICSAYPTSGGLYFWSYKLSGEEWGPFASWMTGWFNMAAQVCLGKLFVFGVKQIICKHLVAALASPDEVWVLVQWAGTASVDYALAQLIQVIILLSTGGANGGGYKASKYAVLGLHGGFLLMHAILNSLPVNWLSILGTFGAAWNVLGVFVLMVLIPAVAPVRANTAFVFKSFNTNNGAGIHSEPYIFVLGLLMSQYTLTGFDVSAHMAEETKAADKNGPYGIISAIGISIIVGWGYILGLTFAVTNINDLLNNSNDAAGYAIAQIFYQSFKDRYGNGTGGIICLGVVAMAIFFSGMSSITSNSRMTYAFSRDGAVPFSKIWQKVNKQEIPLNAVWLSASVSFCMALPSLGSDVAFQAMVSTATIGLYIAYALPILCRIMLARQTFVAGPFYLGTASIPVGCVAVLWVATITVLFSLPVKYPVKKDTLNYTPVAVGGLLVLTMGSWILSAKYWFKGPSTNI